MDANQIQWRKEINMVAIQQTAVRYHFFLNNIKNTFRKICKNKEEMTTQL